MTVSLLPPINIVSGTGGINPLAAGGWVGGSQVKYLGVYNSTSSEIYVISGTDAKVIYPTNADIVTVEGQTVSIGLPPSGFTNTPSIYPTPLVLGTVTAVIYDDQEDYPQGFPYTLPPTTLSQLTLLAYQFSGPAEWFVQVTPSATSVEIGNAGPSPATVTVQGVQSGTIYFSGTLVNTATFNLYSGDTYLAITCSTPLTVYSSTQTITQLQNVLQDSSPNAQYLQTEHALTLIPSPAGRQFGQALSINGGYAQTVSGTHASQGAIAGLASWCIGFIYTPTAADINVAAGIVILSRVSGTAEWEVFLSNTSNLVFQYWDSGGTPHSLIGPVVQAGVPYFVEVDFTGGGIFLFMNGTLVASTASSLTFQAAVNQPLLIGSTVSSTSPQGSIDELAIFTGFVHFASFTLSGGPFLSDGFCAMLYHFDENRSNNRVPGEALTAAPVFAVTVPNPVPGADWAYTVPFPMTLKSVSATYNPGAAGRYPNLRFAIPNSGFVQMWPISTASPTAGSPIIYQGMADGSLTPFMRTGDNSATFGFTRMRLPSGTVIQSVGSSGADQWTNIQLVFSTE